MRGDVDHRGASVVACAGFFREGAGFEVLDMIGKTVLPMRHYRALLAESADRRRWAKIEKTLWRDPAAMGRAAHIQVACRVGRGDP